jgi:hypothetical protein
MSKQELVEAYVQGRLTRRVFVRRLVAAGITLGAASAYAAALAPKAVAQVPGDLHDLYGDAHRSFYGNFYSTFGKSHNPNVPFTTGKGHKGP